MRGRTWSTPGSKKLASKKQTSARIREFIARNFRIWVGPRSQCSFLSSVTWRNAKHDTPGGAMTDQGRESPFGRTERGCDRFARWKHRSPPDPHLRPNGGRRRSWWPKLSSPERIASRRAFQELPEEEKIKLLFEKRPHHLIEPPDNPA